MDTETEAQLMEISKTESKSYKKLGEESPRDFIQAVQVERAGLIILSPYLNTLFERCGTAISVYGAGGSLN